MKFRLFLIPALAVTLLPGLAAAQAVGAKAAPASSSTAATVLNGAAPATLPASPASPAAALNLSAPVSDDSLGSTQLRESAKIKAQIDLEKLRAGLEAAQHERLIAQKKFTQQLEEADKGPESKSGNAVPAAAAAPMVRETPKPYATSFYNFNGQSFARLVFNGAQFVVSPGTQLPEGARVESVSDSNVVLRQNGRKILVSYLGGGVGWGN